MEIKKRHPVLMVLISISLLLLIWAGCLAINTYLFIQSSRVADGQLINQANDDEDDPDASFLKVAYQAAGSQQYVLRSRLGAGFYSYINGDAVSVRYPQDAPAKGVINDFTSLWGVASVIGSIGGFLLLISAIPLLLFRHRSRNQQWLYRHGRYIEAYISKIDRKYAVVNGIPFMIIHATWKGILANERKEYRFSSEAIFEDLMPLKPGAKVAIYINELDPENYFMDVNTLLHSLEIDEDAEDNDYL